MDELKRLFVITLLLLLPSPALAWDKIGFNFRDSSAYVTDGTDETYVSCNAGAGGGSNPDLYPTVRAGVTFGYLAGSGDICRDRNSGIDRRLAGINFTSNDGSSVQSFQVDLSSAGTYTVCIAAGDAGNARDYHRVDIFDNVSSVHSMVISGSPATAAASFADAQGTSHTAANWPGNNICETGLVFATTTLVMKYGATSAQSDQTNIAHLYIEKEASAAKTFSVLNAMGEL